MPQGAFFDAATAQFKWTPDYDQAGDHMLQFAARDPAGRRASAHGDDHRRRRQPRAGLSFSNHHVALGERCASTSSAATPTATRRCASPPAACRKAPRSTYSSGQFTWTPGPGQVGEYLVVLSVSDGKTQVQRGLALPVDALPVGPQVSVSLTPSFPSLPGQPVALTVLADAFSAMPRARSR